jgi:hypothetical protein
MKANLARPVKTWSRLRQGGLVLWAGIAIGVAFLATPAKFLAPSLSLPVALDVGRQTFAIYNRAELGLLVLLLVIGWASRAPRRWYVALAIPGAIVILQTIWLIPVLDHRVAVILAGGVSPTNSNLHAIYIVAELVKVVALLGFGLAAPGQAGDGVASAKFLHRTAGGRDGADRTPPGWRAMPGEPKPLGSLAEGPGARQVGNE